MTTWDNRRISDLDILSIFTDREGVVWIGSGDEGVFRFDQHSNSFENFGFNPKDKNGISSSRINCLFQDSFDVIWIGTAQGGVNKLDMSQKQFINYSNNPYDNNSLAGNLIMDILEDKQGKLWISSYDGEVCRSTRPVNASNIGGLQFDRLKNKMPLSHDEFISCIFQDSKGFIWMCTEESVVVYNPVTNAYKKVEFEHDNEMIGVERFRTIAQVDSNSVVLGGERILILQDPWAKIEKMKNPVLRARPVLDELRLLQVLLKDRKGNYWFGTENGLIQCTWINNEFSIVHEYSTYAESGYKLNSNNIFSLHEDSKGNIWVGTFGGGLHKIILDNSGESLKIESYRKNQLLPDDAVYGIIEQNDEYLWISTDMGLCRLNSNSNEVIVFDMRDGLAQNNFRQSAYFKSKTGYFYFGGLNGLTIFNPGNIKLNEILPKSLITGISVNNKRIKIGENINGKILLAKSIFETSRIVLNQHAKTVTFHLAVQHYTSPEKNKLAYQLEGFNNKWIEADRGKFSLTYTSLPVGEYVLRIKGANGDGIWNTDTTNLKLIVLPPWYQTWWSYALFGLIIIALSIGAFVYFVRLEKLKQRLKYEQIDKKRKDSINQGKLRFFTNISHEFRTPLTLIAGPLERVIERNKDDVNNKYLAVIQNNTKRLMSLVDQLITFRKAEQGHLNLNLTSDTLGNFIYPSTEAFEDYAIQKNINFFYKINSPNEEVVIDIEKTERIIFNLLSNSFRYTPALGNISIETDVIRKDGEKVISIKIIDTGRGIPENKLDKIFDRFYQLEGRRENVGGTGIGLAFCKSLIELMKGTISVESEPDVRTCFTIEIPSKDAEADKSEELLNPGQSFIKDWIPNQDPVHDVEKGKNDNKAKTHSLLIVEDEADVREFLSNDLSENYSVTLAENGEDGLVKLKQNEPDLVVSDVMMPEMNGFDLCEKIKSNPETCHIPVVLLTALDDKESTIKGLEFGADDYISKPFSPKHLKLRIEKLIENNHRIKKYFSKNSSIPDQTIEMSNRDKEFLEQVIGAIERNLSDSDFGVEELAHEIRLSPSQFYRRLKQLTGQIPNAYLRNFRLQRATELLKSNERFSVAEVMYQIGIESSSYFSTSFKKLYGETPSEFIKKYNSRS
jgi:signal transduction histidine kinase/DNA-binding response OmpR family regulator/ligand-binding sensor domain-containing protein